MYETLIQLISGNHNKRFRKILEWLGEDFKRVEVEHKVLGQQIGF